MTIQSFDDYLANLTNLGTTADPTIDTPEGLAIKAAAKSIADLDEVTAPKLTELVRNDSDVVLAIALSVGLSHEQLKNTLRHHLDTTGWVKLSKTQPGDIVDMFITEFDAIRLLDAQRGQTYDYGDVLVARAGGRASAAAAGSRGRDVEDELEAVAKQLGLPYEVRGRFHGRGDGTAPCDLVLPEAGDGALIAVAAKGFNSTGSKLTDAVREVEEMATIRKPSQYVFAVIDGIGWKSRQADLRRIYDMWDRGEIDGMYTLSTLDQFAIDLQAAADQKGIKPV